MSNLEELQKIQETFFVAYVLTYTSLLLLVSLFAIHIQIKESRTSVKSRETTVNNDENNDIDNKTQDTIESGKTADKIDLKDDIDHTVNVIDNLEVITDTNIDKKSDNECHKCFKQLKQLKKSIKKKVSPYFQRIWDYKSMYFIIIIHFSDVFTDYLIFIEYYFKSKLQLNNNYESNDTINYLFATIVCGLIILLHKIISSIYYMYYTNVGTSS